VKARRTYIPSSSVSFVPIFPFLSFSFFFFYYIRNKHVRARERACAGKTAAPRNDRERSENMIHPRKPINLRGFTTCTRLTRMFVQGSLSHRAAVRAGNALFFSPREINSRYTVAPSIRAAAFDARRSRVMNATRRSAADSAVIPRRDRPRRSGRRRAGTRLTSRECYFR